MKNWYFRKKYSLYTLKCSFIGKYRYRLILWIINRCCGKNILVYWYFQCLEKNEFPNWRNWLTRLHFMFGPINVLKLNINNNFQLQLSWFTLNAIFSYLLLSYTWIKVQRVRLHGFLSFKIWIIWLDEPEISVLSMKGTILLNIWLKICL